MVSGFSSNTFSQSAKKQYDSRDLREVTTQEFSSLLRLPADLRFKIFSLLDNKDVTNLLLTCKTFQVEKIQDKLLAPTMLFEELEKMDLTPQAVPEDLHYPMGMALAEICPEFATSFIENLHDKEKVDLVVKILSKLISEGKQNLVKSILKNTFFEEKFKLKLSSFHYFNLLKILSSYDEIFNMVQELVADPEKKSHIRALMEQLTLGFLRFVRKEKKPFFALMEIINNLNFKEFNNDEIALSLLCTVVVGLVEKKAEGKYLQIISQMQPSLSDLELILFNILQQAIRKNVLNEDTVALIRELKDGLNKYLTNPRVDLNEKASLLSIIINAEDGKDSILKDLEMDCLLMLKEASCDRFDTVLPTVLEDQFQCKEKKHDFLLHLIMLIKLKKPKLKIDDPANHFKENAEISQEAAAAICESAKPDFFDPIAMLKKFRVRPEQKQSGNPSQKSDKPSQAVAALFYIKALQHSPYPKVEAEAKAFFEKRMY